MDVGEQTLRVEAVGFGAVREKLVGCALLQSPEASDPGVLRMKGVDCSRHAVDRDAERVQTPSKARQNPSEVNGPRRLGQQPVANGERIRQQRGVEPIIFEPAQVQGRGSARGRGRERSRNALEHGANVGPSGTGCKSKLQDVRSQRFPYKRWRPREGTSLPLFKKRPAFPVWLARVQRLS